MTEHRDGEQIERDLLFEAARDREQSLSRRGFITLSAGAVLLAACGGGGPQNNPAAGGGGGGSGGASYDGPNVELSFWNGFTGGDGPFMRDLVQRFNKENPKVQVKMNVQEWADFYTKLPSAVASGRGPEVAIMHIDQVATNAARNVILPLDAAAKALKLEEADFAPVIWKAGEFRGQRYGLPLDMHPLGFYYNKKVMEKAGLDPAKPPQTRDDYEAALEELKGKDIEGHWVSPFLFTGGLMFQSLVWQFGGELYAPDGSEATYNSPQGVEALTWMVDLVNKGYSPENVAQDAEHTAFQNDKNAFIWNGIWQINEYGKNKELEWGVAPLPQIGSEKAAWASSHNFVLPRQRDADKNKTEAAQFFANWVIEKSNTWAKAGQIPASTKVRESADFKQLEEQSQFANQVPYLHFAPTVPGIADTQAETLDAAVNNAVLGKQEPKAALDEAVQKGNKLLEENRKKYET